MRLTFQHHNEEDVALIRSSIRQSAENHYEVKTNFDQDDKKGILLSAPHPVYHLSNKDIIYEKGLKKAELSAKQYFLLYGESVIGTAEIVTIYKEEKSVKLNYGKPYTSLSELVSRIEDHEISGEFEFSFLKIPSIYIMAVWLRSADQNFFVPFGNIPPEYEAFKLYSEADFLKPAKRLSLINISL